MITFALLSSNDVLTVTFINEKTKNMDFKYSVVVQLGINICWDVIYVCQSPVASQSLGWKCGTFCAATGLRLCVYVYVCLHVMVCVSAE